MNTPHPPMNDAERALVALLNAIVPTLPLSVRFAMHAYNGTLREYARTHPQQVEAGLREAARVLKEVLP